VLRIWGWSLLLCLTGTASLLLLAHSSTFGERLSVQAPVAVIGTSLVAYAVPPSGDDLLGDGRSFIRIAANGMSEETVITVAEQLIAERKVETLLLEAYPFMRDFRGAPHQPSLQTPMQRWLYMLLLESNSIKRTLKAVLGHVLGYQPEPLFLDEVSDGSFDVIDETAMRASYPLRLRRPRLEPSLRDIVDAAKKQGILTFFIAPPRSAAAGAVMGASEAARLDLHIREEASRLNIELLFPATIWPNDFFKDQGHLNRKGRIRFIEELRRAWKVRHGS
jgi:hypothetical protein